MDQNSDKYGQRSQVDVVVGPGTHMPRRLVPQGCRLVCHVAWPRHLSLGVAPEAMPSVDLSRFAPMDKMELTRIHRHTLGRLQPNYKPPYLLNFDMCQSYNYLWEPTSTEGSRGGGSKGWTVPLATAQHPRVATDLLAAYKYPLTLHYKYGVWSVGGP